MNLENHAPIAVESRASIAKELHDGLTQELTAATFYAKILHDELKKANHPRINDVVALQETLGKASASVQQLYKSLQGEK